MPRVKEIDDAGGDPVLEELFAKERATFGDLLNTTKVLAHCPPILRAAKQLSASIAQSGTLSPSSSTCASRGSTAARSESTSTPSV